MHILDTFWSLVDVCGPDDCWPWQGHRFASGGYGRMSRPRFGFEERAHRFSYALAHSGIPRGANVCHTCDNPICVNPAHLFAGTPADNMHDCIRKGRFVYAKSPVGSAHPLAKLTESDVVSIRKLRDEGVPLPELANRYGVSVPKVWQIVHRLSWKHI